MYLQTRLVSPNPNEQNYHIFYQMLTGLSPEERSKKQREGGREGGGDEGGREGGGDERGREVGTREEGGGDKGGRWGQGRREVGKGGGKKGESERKRVMAGKMKWRRGTSNAHRSLC